MKRKVGKKMNPLIGLSIVFMLLLLLPFYPTSASFLDMESQNIGISLTLGNLKSDLLDPSTSTYKDQVVFSGNLDLLSGPSKVGFSGYVKNTGSLTANHAYKVEVVKPGSLTQSEFDTEKGKTRLLLKKGSAIIFDGLLTESSLGGFTNIHSDGLAPGERFNLTAELSYIGSTTIGAPYNLEVNVAIMAVQTNKLDTSTTNKFFDTSQLKLAVRVNRREYVNGFDYTSTNGRFVYNLKELNMYFGKDKDGLTATLNYGKVRILIPDGIAFADLRFTSSLVENGSRITPENTVDFDPTSRIATVKYKVANDGGESAWKFDGRIIIEKLGMLVQGQYDEIDQIPFNDQNGRRGVARKLYLNTDQIVQEGEPFTKIVESEIAMDMGIPKTITIGFEGRENLMINAVFTPYPITDETISAVVFGENPSWYTITNSNQYKLEKSKNGNSLDTLEVKFSGDTHHIIQLRRSLIKKK